MPIDYQDSQISVKITRIRQIDDLDFGLNQADFLGTLKIGDYPVTNLTQVNSQDDLRPTNWSDTKVVSGTDNFLPITIRINEDDGLLDQHIDINPNSGKDLNLNLNLLTGESYG